MNQTGHRAHPDVDCTVPGLKSGELRAQPMESLALMKLLPLG